MAFHHSPQLVTNGLEVLLDASNTKSYPGSGTTWNDLTGNYTFTTSVPPTFTTDVRGVKCFDFTTTAHEYFQSTTNSSFSGNTFAITVTAVLNENSTNNYQTVLGQNYGDTTDAMSFCSLLGKFGTDHWSPGGERLVSTPSQNVVRMVTWVIPQWSLHQSAQRIYFGGTEQPTEPYSVDTVGSLVAQPLIIGNWQIDRTDMDWDGQIYYVAVYNRELTNDEITQNYNALKGRFGL